MTIHRPMRTPNNGVKTIYRQAFCCVMLRQCIPRHDSPSTDAQLPGFILIKTNSPWTIVLTESVTNHWTPFVGAHNHCLPVSWPA